MTSNHMSAMAAATAAFIGFAPSAFAANYAATGLVSDDTSLHPAQIADPDLVNAWGVSYAPNGEFWISNNGTGTSTLYTVSPTTQATTKVGLTVAIPGDGSVTGQIFNNAGPTNFNGNVFVFVSEDGTVSGWTGSLGSQAQTLQVGTAANIYKGAAFASIGSNAYLYATNFGTGHVDVVKGNSSAPTLTGNFSDAGLPTGYAPFGIQNLGNSLYVTYALTQPGSDDEVDGPGLGIVDQYDLQGNLLGRVATGGTLNAPWGLAIAPASFGAFAGDLLVGSFGDGHINAFDPTTHAFVGQVTGPDGKPLGIEGLWALTIGNDFTAGSTQSLYFTSGPGDESHGLFGVLTAVPEPSTTALMLLGAGALGLVGRRRRGADEPAHATTASPTRA